MASHALLVHSFAPIWARACAHPPDRSRCSNARNNRSRSHDNRKCGNNNSWCGCRTFGSTQFPRHFYVVSFQLFTFHLMPYVCGISAHRARPSSHLESIFICAILSKCIHLVLPLRRMHAHHLAVASKRIDQMNGWKLRIKTSKHFHIAAQRLFFLRIFHASDATN